MFHALFSISGRMRRTSFWLCQLLVFVIAVAAFFGSMARLFVIFDNAEQLRIEDILTTVGGLLMVAPILFWIDIALVTKRSHDAGFSGWPIVTLKIAQVPATFFLFMISPSAGSVLSVSLALLYMAAVLILGCLGGTSGPNRFGPDPRVRGALPSGSSASTGMAFGEPQSAYGEPTGETALQAAMNAAIARGGATPSAPVSMRSAAPAPVAARATAKPGFGRRGR